MKYTLHILCTLLILLLSGHAGAQAGNHKMHVLFIGNSYTYVNNLPVVTDSVAASAGDTLVQDVNAIGGYTLQMHSVNTTTLAKIAAGNWDYVVLQEQSQMPSFPIEQIDTEVFPYAKMLDSLVHAQNSCGRTMFYMTWGREYGDTGNCASWPPVCTYDGMDSLLRLRYMMMADSNHAVVSPVGAVWHYIRAHYPSISLYQPDQSHPVEAGTYAAACCFYVAIFKRDPTLITYNFTLPAADAANIRNAVKQVVYDSLAKWHIGEYDPSAHFSYTPGSGHSVTFTNTSSDATSYYWSFGDGLTSTASNPTHTYTGAGTYTVTLVAMHCGKSDTTHSAITIAPSGIGQPGRLLSFLVYPDPAQNSLNITSPLFETNAYTIKIYNVLEQELITTASNSSANQSINISALPTGTYILSVTDKEQRVYHTRFLKI